MESKLYLFEQLLNDKLFCPLTDQRQHHKAITSQHGDDKRSCSLCYLSLGKYINESHTYVINLQLAHWKHRKSALGRSSWLFLFVIYTQMFTTMLSHFHIFSWAVKHVLAATTIKQSMCVQQPLWFSQMRNCPTYQTFFKTQSAKLLNKFCIYLHYFHVCNVYNNIDVTTQSVLISHRWRPKWFKFLYLISISRGRQLSIWNHYRLWQKPLFFDLFGYFKFDFFFIILYYYMYMYCPSVRIMDSNETLTYSGYLCSDLTW